MSSIIVKELSVEFPIVRNKNSELRSFFYRKKKQSFKALDNVSFSLHDGDRLGLLGVNGSGKSTLLKVLSSSLSPTNGEFKIVGKTTAALNVREGMLSHATCIENIRLKGLLFGFKGKRLNEYVASVSELSGLGDFLNSPLNTLSAGMRSKLLVSMFDDLTADIFLMDEWIGTADNTVLKKNGLLKTIVNDVNIFVIASHREKILKELCNKGLVLNKGKVTFVGDIHDAIQFHNENKL